MKKQPTASVAVEAATNDPTVDRVTVVVARAATPGRWTLARLLPGLPMRVQIDRAAAASRRVFGRPWRPHPGIEFI